MSVEVGKIWEEIREGETMIRIYCMNFQLKKKRQQSHENLPGHMLEDQSSAT